MFAIVSLVFIQGVSLQFSFSPQIAVAEGDRGENNLEHGEPNGVGNIDTPTGTPVCSMGATKTITKGERAELSWSTNNALVVRLTNLGKNGSDILEVDPIGSKFVNPKNTRTYYVYAVNNGVVDKCSQKVIVKKNTPKPKTPSCELTSPNPEREFGGEKSKLVWTTKNATKAVLRGVGIDGKDTRPVSITKGQRLVNPGKTRTYSLKVTGPGGTHVCKQEIVVTEKN